MTSVLQKLLHAFHSITARDILHTCETLLIGLADTFGKVFFPSVSSVLIYVLMAAVLLWRPNGILGRREV